MAGSGIGVPLVASLAQKDKPGVRKSSSLSSATAKEPVEKRGVFRKRRDICRDVVVKRLIT